MSKTGALHCRRLALLGGIRLWGEAIGETAVCQTKINPDCLAPTAGEL
ncbi:MAG: hypothetical protein ACE5EY_17140 [Anaerolineae bacterium]